MKIKRYDIERDEIVIVRSGTERRFAQALAEIETDGGATATAVLTAQADKGGSRHMVDVRPENVRILSGEIDKADIADALNTDLDDTDPDRPEYAISYAAAESLGEAETNAKSARERLKTGQVVRLRVSAANGQNDLPDTTGADYYSMKVARASAIRAAKKVMDDGDRDTDWSGWRVEATTNDGDTLFSIDFERARRQ